MHLQQLVTWSQAVEVVIITTSLDLSSAGTKETDVQVDQQMRQIRRQQAYTEEARLMELSAEEGDGELEGSGDDFDGY